MGKTVMTATARYEYRDIDSSKTLCGLAKTSATTGEGTKRKNVAEGNHEANKTVTVAT
jgi:hypothetical protein